MGLLSNTLPKEINYNMFYDLGKHEIVDENKTAEYVNKVSEQRFEREKERQRQEAIDELLTNSIQNKFFEKMLNKYFKSSYLIRLAKGEEVEDSKKCSEFTLAMNRIIRLVIQERKNDFELVIDKIIQKVQERNVLTVVNGVEPDKSADTLLSEALDEVDADKLTKYQNNVADTICKVAYKTLSNEFNDYCEKFISKNMEKIDSKVNTAMEKFKKEDLVTYRENVEKGLVRLYNFIFTYEKKRVNFIDKGKSLLMLKNVKLINEKVVRCFGAGYGNDYVDIKLEDIDHVERLGSTFTIILKGGINVK